MSDKIEVRLEVGSRWVTFYTGSGLTDTGPFDTVRLDIRGTSSGQLTENLRKPRSVEFIKPFFNT